MTARASQLDLMTNAPSHPYGRGEAAGYQRGSDTSREAAVFVGRTLAQRQQDVLDLIRARGTATCKEVATAWRCGMNAVSGRFTELHTKLGLIEQTGERRDGCAVYRVRS